MSLLSTLRTVLSNPEAIFRGLQERVIRAVAGGKSPILAIIAIRAGKSIAFLLPAAAVSNRITVVIVLLLALRDDLCRRCEAIMIPYAV